jgi:hypothetical protein
VTNFFGMSNFMQPMVRPKHALKVPCFFSFQVFGGGRIFFPFFPFFPGSQCEPTMFPLSSQWVFLSNSQYVPQRNLHSTSLLSHMLWQMLSSCHLFRWAKGGGALYIQIEQIEQSTLGTKGKVGHR